MSDTLWLHLDLKATNIIWTFMAKSQLGRCLNTNHISSRIKVAIDKWVWIIIKVTDATDDTRNISQISF